MSSAQVGAVLRHLRQLARDDHELPDDQLLERFATRRDEAAFAALLKRHGPMVLSVCRSVLHDLHDAEDAFQAAFLLLVQKAGSIHRRQAVSGWLYRVAYHLAVRARANAARRRVLEKRAVTMPSADPVLDLSLRELRGMLFEELEGLPEPYRPPLVLCGLEERSLEEAARLLGWTRGTVKGRLQRGRELLRARLRRRGLELPTALFAAALGLNATSGRVSATLADATLRAAVQVAAGGHVASGVVSAEVAALVQGMGLTMFFSKARIATALLLAVSVAVTAFGVLRHQASASDQPAPPQGQVQKPRPQANQPPPGAQPKADTDGAIEVRGRVLDPDGKTVAGAKLYLTKPNGPAPSQKAASGPDGRFRFAVPRSELEEGDAESSPQVMAVAAGHGCDWAAVGPAAEELTLRLVKDVPVGVRILDPDGKPVAGARLTVRGVSAPKDDLGGYIEEARKGYGYAFAKHWNGPLPGQPAVLTTGPDGRFRLTGAGRERVVHLRVEGPAIASTGLTVMTRASEPIKNPRERTVAHGASSDYVGIASRPIRGVVRDKETGKPLAGVSVGPPGSWDSTVTDKEGRYELLGLSKKPDYVLGARPGDGLHFQRRVKVRDTPGFGALTCDIELVRALTVQGRVTDRATGNPIAGARIDYHPLGGNAYVNKLLPGSWDPCAEATTGADGSYAITVMPGPGVLGVKAPRLDKYMPAAVPLKERRDFFKTRLVDDKDEDGFTRYAGGGSYGGLTLDSYNAAVLLEPGEKEEALLRDVALERPQERKGQIVGPDSRPLTGVTVMGLVPSRFTVETLQGDAFTVRGVNPRANRPLVFYHQEKDLGFYLKDLRGEEPGPLAVKLQPCGSASGRVVDQDSLPVAGLRLHVPGRALRSTGEERWVTTDRDGRFRAAGLVPGLQYWVWDASGSFPRVFTTVVVETGQHKDMGDIKMIQRDN